MSRSSSKSPGQAGVRSIVLQTPSFQSWSCGGCTDCCRGNLLIEVSPEEAQRIQAQGWTTAEGVDPKAMLVTERGRTRLGCQSDGACVFLDPAGRCRIHAKFGEEAKPLACRLYPLAIHPGGQKLLVSLRYSCPAAARNEGKPLSEQLPDLRKLANCLVPANYRPGKPPPVLRETELDWEDFMRYVSWLDKTLSPADVPMSLKLLRALHWLKAVAKAGFDQLTGPGADEILETLVRNASEKLPALPANGGTPSRLSRFFLRQMAVECARPPKAGDIALTSSYRWSSLWALIQSAFSSGRVPPIGDEPRPVRFGDVEKSFGPLPSTAEAMLTRAFRVKIQGLHFCGPAFYGLSLSEGFSGLAFGFCAIVWLTRWHAAKANRTTLSEEDVVSGLRMVDRQLGYAQGVAVAAARHRVQLLARRDDVARLCCWSAR